MPPLTQLLLIANGIVFVAQIQLVPAVVGWFALWPLGSGLFMPWQPASYAFLHGGLSHLLFNMFGLWMFGSALEQVWGARRMAVLYGVSVLVAAAAQLAVTAALGSAVPTVGASGGLFGLLVAFAMMFPQRRIMLLIPPIPLPAWLFVTLYGLVELFLGVTGSASGVAHFAHLGGLAGGFMVMRYWRAQRRSGDWRR